jgi:hypothetical protein
VASALKTSVESMACPSHKITETFESNNRKLSNYEDNAFPDTDRTVHFSIGYGTNGKRGSSRGRFITRRSYEIDL